MSNTEHPEVLDTNKSITRREFCGADQFLRDGVLMPGNFYIYEPVIDVV